MSLVDFHCHFEFEDFDDDRLKIIEKMKNEKIIAVANSINFENYLKVSKMFENVENVLVCAGLYPQDAEKISESEFKKYIELIRKNKEEIFGLGEIGLDLHHTKDRDLFEIQIKRFRSLIELGIELDKPLIIHTRKAEKEVLEIIEEYVKKTGFKKFDLHCFTGKKKFIAKIKELEIYCSIPLTVLNTQSFRILVEELDLNQLLVETDSPYLNPSRERNTPLNIPLIYSEIAKIKGLSVEEVKKKIYENFKRIS